VRRQRSGIQYKGNKEIRKRKRKETDGKTGRQANENRGHLARTEKSQNRAMSGTTDHLI
jgi:hypothetical protein